MNPALLLLIGALILGSVLPESNKRDKNDTPDDPGKVRTRIITRTKIKYRDRPAKPEKDKPDNADT